MTDTSGAAPAPAAPTPAPSGDANNSTCQHCGLPIMVVGYGLPGGSGGGAKSRKWTHANGVKSCITAKGKKTTAQPNQGK